MALSRKFLASLKLEADVIDTIIEAHGETVDALKKQRDDAIAASGNIEELTKERDELRTQLEELKTAGGDVAKVQAEFDAYKKQVEDERLTARTDADVLDMLKEAGIQRETFRTMAAKAFDRSKIKRGDDGNIANRDELLTAIKTEFADCIASDPTPSPAPRVDPPAGSGTPKDPFERGFDE